MTLKIFITIFLISFIISAQNKTTKPCSSPEASQFNFWLGDWITKWLMKDGSEKTGENHVINLFNGCVIEENFDGEPGTDLQGKSFSVYSTREKIWKQTWVDNYGAYLDFKGKFENGEMILTRSTSNENGDNMIQRMIYYNITQNEFDWNWEISNDNGKTWDLKWKLHYTRKPE